MNGQSLQSQNIQESSSNLGSELIAYIYIYIGWENDRIESVISSPRG